MNGALSIAMREVRERRVVLAAALIAGLLPFASPLLPGVSAAQAGDARDVMARVLAGGVGLVLALLLGATAIASDLAENRLGFDFARPVGGFAIWGGRLGAAVGLTIVSMAIIAAPATLVAGRLNVLDPADPEGWLAPIGGVLLAVALAHAVSVAIRSRSRWLVLDLVGLVVVLLLAVGGVRRIGNAFALITMILAAKFAIVAAIPIFWIASALQVVRGRTDLVAGHRVQSIVLWPMLLVVALGIAGYSVWLVSADVSDLEKAWAAPAPDGSVIAVAGFTTGREVRTEFLLDVETGRSIRLGTAYEFAPGNTLFSRDGRRAVDLRRAGAADPKIDVVTIDLAAPVLERRETQLAFTAGTGIIPALSPSGRRLAILQGRNLAVHDLDSGRILAAVKLDTVNEDCSPRVAFVDEDRVRVYVLADRLVAHEFDVPTRKLALWTGPEAGDDPALSWRRDHERLILEAPSATGTVLLDGRSGTVIAQLAAAARASEGRPKLASHSRFLADGRIVRVADAVSGRTSLDLFTPDGAPLRSFDLGPSDAAGYFVAGPEVTPGTITVARRPRGSDGWYAHAGRLLLFELETGRTREVVGGGDPLAASHWMLPDTARPGSVASRLIARDRAVWLLDPAAATLRLVAGRPVD